jgi:uncharacterized protein (TIGR00304 family)
MEKLILAGFAFLFIGVALIFAGILLSAASGKTSIEGAGIIMIGPVPIMFGSKRLLLPLALLAIVLMLVFYLLFWKH